MPLVLLAALIAAALAAFVVATNYFVDPAGLYHARRRRQLRNLRLRKLSLLKGLRRMPCATLILGSSRVFNLSLTGDARFAQPTLNFAVTTAKAEDYLAGYRLVRAAQGTAPRLVIVGIEHPAFHPTLPPQWEAYTAGAYTKELEALGALRVGATWRWRMLLSPLQFHQSLIEVQRRWRNRGGAPQKFRWSADGSGTWHDLLQGKRNPRLLRRQLRNFPRTGLAARSYTKVGEQRLGWFETLLRDCAVDGASVVAYIVPAHPLLVDKTWELGFRPVHEQLVDGLQDHCSAHGAHFADWFDCAKLCLDAEYFRDVMHLTDEGQAVVAVHLAKVTGVAEPSADQR